MQELDRGVLLPDNSDMAPIQTWATMMGHSINEALPYRWDNQAAQDAVDTENLLVGTMGYRVDEGMRAYYWTGSTWFPSGGGTPIHLINTDNLNSITNPGTYYNITSANATSANNYPMENAGFLEVFSFPGTARVMQRYTSEASVEGNTFVRFWYTTTGWGNWRAVGDRLVLVGIANRNRIHQPYPGLKVFVYNDNIEYVRMKNNQWGIAEHYNKGETYSFSVGSAQIPFTGMVTSDNKSIFFTVPLPKPVAPGVNIALGNIYGNCRGSTGGYWSVGNYVSGGYNMKANGMTSSISNVVENIVNIRVVRTTNFFATNNMPISMDMSQLVLNFT